MKGSRGILAIAAIAILFAAMPVWSQEEYAKPLDKSISPGRTVVKFDGIAYNFITQGTYNVRFEKIDTERVKLTLKPVKPDMAPFPVVYVQWENFGTLSFGVTAPEGNNYILNTETGYAEK